MLKTVIWWTTWSCNYHCVYCWQVQAQEQGLYPRTKPPDESQQWLAAWKRLAPQALDITGGEPFLIPGLVDILAGLHHSTKLAITTNLSHSIEDFLGRVPADHFLQVTCSLHPTQKTFNEALFFGRALQLRRRGYPVVINFVGWPEQLWLAESYRQRCRDWGLRFHFDPYGATYREVNWSETELAEIRRLRESDRAPHPFTEQFGREYSVLCSAGQENLSVWPDGTAYRCVLDEQLRLPPVGNVFDPDFRLNPGKTPCSEHWRCAGCDRDKVTVDLVFPGKAPG